LVQRADRHIGALGDEGRRQGVVSDLGDELLCGVEHPLNALHAAPLHGRAA
jgi:hypothetical protein